MENISKLTLVRVVLGYNADMASKFVEEFDDTDVFIEELADAWTELQKCEHCHKFVGSKNLIDVGHTKMCNQCLSDASARYDMFGMC